MKAPSRPLVIVLISVLVVAAGVGAAFAFKPDLVDSVMLSLSGSTQEVTAGEDSPASSAGTPKAEDTATTTPGDAKTPATNGSGGSGDTGGSGTSSGGSGGTDTGSDDSSTEYTKDPGETTTAKGVNLRILWWNDAKDKDPKGFEIVYGSKTIKPDVSKASGSGSIGPCPVGTEAVLVVYPDGRDGKRFEVPFTVSKGMEPNSDIDAIHVEVSDTGVRVLGNAVKNFDQSYARF